ncbi:MAG: FmdB family zinc ribbon protein [Anaerolineales bacterium]|jgi:putative FmdB family regulatory protein
MPIYAYRCESCGVHFERQQSFSDAPLKRCPECNKNTLVKVIGPVGVVFKGSGFYSTDNRSTSGLATPAKKEEGNSSEKSESKSSTEGSSKETVKSEKKE